MHGPIRKNKNAIVFHAAKITIRNATEIRDQIKASATSIRSGSQRTQWRQWIEANKSRKGINKTISKNYSQDLALYIQNEGTRSSSA